METFRSVVRQMEGKISYATKLDELAEIDELFHATLSSWPVINTRLVEMALHLLCDHIQNTFIISTGSPCSRQEYADRHHAVAEAVLLPATSNMWFRSARSL